MVLHLAMIHEKFRETKIGKKNIPVLHNFEASHLILQNFHPESLL